MLVKIFLFLFLIGFSPVLYAQDYDSLLRLEEQHIKDSLKLRKVFYKDSLKKARLQKQIRRPMSNALRATLLSAALPGAGQIYNKSWWWAKLPIFYGAFALVGYNLYTTQNEYVNFRDNFLYSKDNNPLTVVDIRYASYNADQMKAQRDRALRERDYNIILLLVIYGLNMAEAATTAHLKRFDVSDDLSLQVQPKIFNTNGSNLTAGLSFTLRLKK